MLSKIFNNKGTALHKKKSFWSTFKNAYIRKKDFRKIWYNLDKTNISKEIVEVTNIFVDSESYNLTSKFWRHMISYHYKHLITCPKDEDPLTDILRLDYSGFSYLDGFTINKSTVNTKNNIKVDGNLLKKHKGLTISESLQYNLVLLILYEQIKSKKIFQKYELINKEVYEKYTPCINLDNKILSQNMIISMQECEKIFELTSSIKKPLKILELGAGYGRTANMVLSMSEGVKYVIADLPLSINFSMKNISQSFKNKKIKAGFKIDNTQEMMQAFNDNDILFILPHQIKLFEPKTFDLTISIGNLCEMEKKQIEYYMNVYEIVSNFLYMKVWDISGLPFSFYAYYDVNKKEDYAIKKHWKEHFKNPVFMPSNIYELGFEF
jgi:hypothetical protein